MLAQSVHVLAQCVCVHIYVCVSETEREKRGYVQMQCLCKDL